MIDEGISSGGSYGCSSGAVNCWSFLGRGGEKIDIKSSEIKKKSFSRYGFYSPGIVIQLNTRLFLPSLDKIRLFRHEKRAKYTVVLNAPRTAWPTICIS